MERLKDLPDVLIPDSRMTAFRKADTQRGEFVPITLEDLHRSLAAIELHETVPDEVRSYFETAKNVCLFGWFVYPFFTTAVFLSYTAVEFALRVRLPQVPGRRQPGLGKLMKMAITEGLISDTGFPTLQRRRAYIEALGSTGDQKHSEGRAAYTSILRDTFPYLRNTFAHPASLTILTPADATSSLVRAAEIINQLFPH
jgi:hypothetical protein